MVTVGGPPCKFHITYILYADIMTYALSTFVSIPSVSSNPLHLEDCRQAAIWLKNCLHQLGAESTLVRLCLCTITSDRVLTFNSCLRVRTGVHWSCQPFTERKANTQSIGYCFMGRVALLICCLLVHNHFRHYDVISAPRDGWDSDPFTVTGRNGYLYGRGVTDNKGPILAVACAAAELLRKRALGVDLVFLIEGEEEAGSPGFMDAVTAHKV